MFLEVNPIRDINKGCLENSTTQSISELQAKIIKKYKRMESDPLQTSFDVQCNQDYIKSIQQLPDEEYLSDANFLNIGVPCRIESLAKSRQKIRKSSFEQKYIDNEQLQIPLSPILISSNKRKKNQRLFLRVNEKLIVRNQIRMMFQKIKQDFEFYKNQISLQLKQMCQFISFQGQNLQILIQQNSKKQSTVSAKNKVILKLQKEVLFLKEENHSKAMAIKDMQISMKDQQIIIEKMRQQFEKQNRQNKQSSSKKLTSLDRKQQVKYLQKSPAKMAVSVLIGNNNPKNFSIEQKRYSRAKKSNENCCLIAKDKVSEYESYLRDSVYIYNKTGKNYYSKNDQIDSSMSSQNLDIFVPEVKRSAIYTTNGNQSRSQNINIKQMNRSANQMQNNAQKKLKKSSNLSHTFINKESQNKTNRRTDNMIQLQDKIKKLKEQL